MKENQDMLKLADYIDALYQHIKNTKVDNLYIQDIYMKIQENAHLVTQNGYSILRGVDVMPAFILNNWTFRETVEGNLESLHALSKSIRETFIAHIGKQLTEQKVSEMLELADSGFAIINRLLRHEPIDILLVNNTCRYANALYCINSNPGIIKRDLIVLTYVSDKKVLPAFAFLHELGHMIHTRITRKIFVPPKSFKALHETIFKYTGINPEEAPNKWLAEWFAECFAIAVVHDTPYSSLNYHNEMAASDKKIIVEYMNNLLSET